MLRAKTSWLDKKPQKSFNLADVFQEKYEGRKMKPFQWLRRTSFEHSRVSHSGTLTRFCLVSLVFATHQYRHGSQLRQTGSFLQQKTPLLKHPDPSKLVIGSKMPPATVEFIDAELLDHWFGLADSD